MIFPIRDTAMANNPVSGGIFYIDILLRLLTLFAPFYFIYLSLHILFAFMIKGWRGTHDGTLGTSKWGNSFFYSFYFYLYSLFMVVRFPFYNSTCAIERLGKDKAHHLMREGHLEREIFSLARSW